ncbi:DUF6624 domain-containing protein [Frateuria sp.]|uniref:DUF6624 domain-containing protein n=1 Tax=Frateuria sp. TaxID=2211372 RepID=UPI003F7E6C9A
MDKALEKQLIDLDDHDQRIRAELAADGSLFDGYHSRMEAVHRANAARLRAIIADHGWPGFSLVGERGAQAAWRIAQHSIGEPAFMRQCRDLLCQASANHDAHAWQHAYMDDRIRVLEGLPQRYGTQFRDGDHGPEPFPMEDPENIEARRQALGLPPLTEIVARAGKNPSPVRGDPAAREAEELAWRKRVGWV